MAAVVETTQPGRVDRVGRVFAPLGAFDLGQSLAFEFGGRDAAPGAGAMRLAFVLDGPAQRAEHAGVVVRQRPDGTVTLDVTGTDRVADARRQAARVLSLDVDATGWDALGARDPLVGELQAARPGLRPPLFCSAYEAAAWAVLSARRPQTQMAALRDRLSAAAGAVLTLDGVDVPAFPTPQALLAVEEFPGLPGIKLDRLHGVAAAALAGELDTDTLRAADPDDARASLRRLAGIGPFSADLVVVRALGHTDVVAGEVQPTALAAELLGEPEPLGPERFAALVAPWSPWRTWATVAVRAAGRAALDRR